MYNILMTSMALVVALVLTSTTASGQTHIEVDDAGSTAGTAQPTKGIGPLYSIQGGLEGVGRGGEPDYIDMFVIEITDANGFSMSTDPGDGGYANFDSQLWLFRYGPVEDQAFGLLGADEIPSGPAGAAHLVGPATDATGQTIPGPGLYLVAISGYNHDPVSAGGPIFDQAERTEISGPDGPGGADPHTGWFGAGETGNYNIALTGAAFATPIPTVTDWGLIALALLLIAAAAVVMRRNRRVGCRDSL